MGEDRKSGIQKLYTGAVSSSTAERMQAESEDWLVRCPYCGFERSVWETGGVRYKAAGRSRWLLRCPNCGRMAWNVVYRKGDTPPALASPERRRLLWIVGLGALVLVVVAFVATLFLILNATVGPVVSAGDSFMGALKSGDYRQAYNLCTPALQNDLGTVSGLTNRVQGYQPSKWSWSGRSVRNGQGLLDGSLNFGDGKQGTIHLTLQQVDSNWRIDSFRINPK